MNCLLNKLKNDHPLFKTIFNIHRIEKTKKLHDRLDRYDKKRGLREGRKLLFKEKEVKRGLNDQ